MFTQGLSVSPRQRSATFSIQQLVLQAIQSRAEGPRRRAHTLPHSNRKRQGVKRRAIHAVTLGAPTHTHTKVTVTTTHDPRRELEFRCVCTRGSLAARLAWVDTAAGMCQPRACQTISHAAKGIFPVRRINNDECAVGRAQCKRAQESRVPTLHLPDDERIAARHVEEGLDDAGEVLTPVN